jgi:diguanylate cyclase (GGDEF)-like protein
MGKEMKTSGTPQKVWTTFTVKVSLIIIIFSFGVFFVLAIRNDHLINQEIKTRAVNHFQSIVLTRRWNSGYNGVFVEKTEGVVSNPYLVDPDMEGADGKVYTKKNPAIMTQEISRLAEAEGLFSFHITSLKPLNPANRVDQFELQALTSFEKGETEYFRKVREKGTTYFRYMAPLTVEEGCLQCHAHQGYKLGDVRGGISVKLDIGAIEHSLRVNRIAILSLAIISPILLLGIIHFFIRRLVRTVREAQQKIEEMATTDELTGLHNRRFFFERFREEVERAARHGHHLTCLMIDIDYFKKVNDRYGHHAGDLVLKNVATALRSSCRNSDILARYGGEELVLLLPETDQAAGLVVAEKMRKVVEDQTTVADGSEIKVTISIGLSSHGGENQKEVGNSEKILKSADAALYRAKQNGRNRVEVELSRAESEAAP